MKSPSKAQVDFAEEIASVLGLDFPANSTEYNAQAYYFFIRDNLPAYQSAMADTVDPDDCYDMCANDAWCEYY